MSILTVPIIVPHDRATERPSLPFDRLRSHHRASISHMPQTLHQHSSITLVTTRQSICTNSRYGQVHRHHSAASRKSSKPIWMVIRRTTIPAFRRPGLGRPGALREHRGARAIKREFSEQELIRRPNNDVLRPFWAKERLRNEAATLEYVALNTPIPVPQCGLYTKDGLFHETKRITNGFLLNDIDRESRSAAATVDDEQIQSFILSQLRSLSRKYIGSVGPSITVLDTSSYLVFPSIFQSIQSVVHLHRTQTIPHDHVYPTTYGLPAQTLVTNSSAVVNL